MSRTANDTVKENVESHAPRTCRIGNMTCDQNSEQSKVDRHQHYRDLWRKSGEKS